ASGASDSRNSVRRWRPRRPTRRAIPSNWSAHRPRRSGMRIGYFLACEEFGPAELLDQATMAQEAGFQALWISDHYHPWVDAQGQSPFVWSVIGALSRVCDLPVTTAVTCLTMRIHPAVVAQAAATSAVMH